MIQDNTSPLTLPSSEELARSFFIQEVPAATEQDFEVSLAMCDGNWSDVVMMYHLGQIMKRQND